MTSTILPEKELPPALKRKLVFGDREQIAAIYDVEHKINQMEKEKNLKISGELKEYRVLVEYQGDTTVKVWARTRHEAESLAEEKVDIDKIDFDIDFSAHEIRG